MNEKLDAISDQLKAISDDLADIAIEALRETIDDKEFSGKRPEKAVRFLSQPFVRQPYPIPSDPTTH